LELNITLVVQMLVFLAFVWFTMRFVWPPVEKALQERQNKIADGLAAAERGHRELELAQHRATDQLRQAKAQALEILEKANRRAAQLIDEAKEAARAETLQMISMAEERMRQELQQAKAALRKEVASFAVLGAEKILMREIDAEANQKILDHLIEEF